LRIGESFLFPPGFVLRARAPSLRPSRCADDQMSDADEIAML
jgi:hypothetical protein